MADNPRIDDLRKRLEKEPGSRLFAQLAEELRKGGDLEESIRVCREGLGKHPNYPSARMTLGRSLLDTGDLGAARGEFESVLKGAADNILASRFLAECLEGLGDLPAAQARYKTTLMMAPGDKNVQARLQALEQRMSAPPAAPAAAAPVPEPEPAPIALAQVEDESFELEQPHSALAAAPAVRAPEPQAAPEPEPAPIKLVAAEESFELEQPYEAVARAAKPSEPPAAAPAQPAVPAAPVAPPAAPVAVAPPAAPVVSAPAPATGPQEEEFEFEPATMPFRPRPLEDMVGGWSEREAVPAPPPPPAAPAEEIASATLAELYFNQGFTDKAIDVYRRLLEREPGNVKAGARLQELEMLERHLQAETARAAAPAPAGPAAGGTATRREALERTIARLEAMLGAVGSMRQG